MNRKFNYSIGAGNTIRAFDAEHGTLYRTIAVGQPIVGQPQVAGNELKVQTNNGEVTYDVPSFQVKTPKSH